MSQMLMRSFSNRRVAFVRGKGGGNSGCWAARVSERRPKMSATMNLCIANPRGSEDPRLRTTQALQPLTRPVMVQQQVECVAHRTGPRELAGVDEENLVGIFDRVQPVRNDHLRRGLRQFAQD